MTCQDSFHEVAFNISFWTRNISSARILFWRGVLQLLKTKYKIISNCVETSHFTKHREFIFAIVLKINAKIWLVKHIY